MKKDNILSLALLLVGIAIAILVIVQSCEIEPKKTGESYFFFQGYGHHDLRPATYEELKAVYDDIDKYYFDYYTAVSRGENPNKERAL